MWLDGLVKGLEGRVLEGRVLEGRVIEGTGMYHVLYRLYYKLSFLAP
jgi:hypothetical protein